jgi:glyceraldehyde-3-phosphate dehydrogenase [NAD(P)+]
MSQKRIHRREQLYIDGEWLDADDVLDVTDLAEDGVFAEVAAADAEHAEQALAAAQRAQAEMRETTIPQRAEWMETIADGLLERKEELADVIVREAGKPISSARGEVESAAERFRRAAEEAHNLRGEYREGTTKGHEGWEAIVKPEPIGTVLAITPYNYPLSTTALWVAPALAAGNCVILKPASKTPVSAAILADVISEVDVPNGAFNFTPGRGSEIGDLLVGDNRINMVAMTGSSAAGKHVSRTSGMVDLHMELGGNAPAVVFPDANLSDVAGACAKGSFKYAGQRCSAVSRVVAHEDVHDDVVERLDATIDQWTVGDLFDEETQMGPLISEEQADWVEELVEDAVEKGADLVRGGERDGQFFEPTLLANVPHDARIIDEEQFGPIAAVTTFESEEEALELSNRSDLALDASVFTKDYDRARRMADKLDAGAVRINGAPSHGLGDIPFGGNKASGIGRQGLRLTIEEMVRRKSIIL